LDEAVAFEAPMESVDPRVSVDLSRGWRFRQAVGLSDVPSGTFDDTQWTALEIPRASKHP
jgi:hypothetical protein